MATSANAIELGVAYISIIGETRDLSESVKDAIRGAQLYADRNPINLKANIDVSHIGAVEIPVVADTSRFDTAVRRAITAAKRNVRDTTIKLRLEADPSRVPAQVQRMMREIGRLFDFEVPIKAVPNFDTFPREVLRRLQEIERLFDFRLEIPVDLDAGRAMVEAALLQRQLDGLRRPVHAEVDVNVDRDANTVVRSLTSGLGSIAKMAGSASAAAAGIAVIGGAAGAAVGAVSALGIGLISLGPAAAAAAATVAVGVQGIGDAVKALSAADDAASNDMQAQAKAVAAAEDQLISAYEQKQTALEAVQDAQRNLTDAQKDARDAAKDIGQAYKDATQELEDYVFAVKDAALSEAEAKDALIEAREEFAKAPPKDREKAYHRLQRADLRYQQAVEKNKDTQREANDAFAKGVEGSDKVVAAKERAAQADQRVADAQRSVEKANQQVEKANRQVEKAQQALNDAMNKSSSAADKAAQAMAKLSPNAQAFVLAVRDLMPAWTDLRSATQDALFDGAAQGIKDLANSAFPTLKAGMTGVATSINGLTKDFAAFWSAPQNLDGVRAAFAGAKGLIDGLSPGVQQATQGFLSLAKAFEPVSNKVGAQFAGMLGQIGQAFTDTFASGQLTQLISTFGDVLQGLGEGLNPLIQGLIEMGNIVGPTLGPLFKTLGESIGALGPSLGQIGATFATTLTAILPDLSRFIAALVTGLEPVLPVIGELLRSVMTALTPLIEPLSQIAQVVGTALAQAITALAPSIGPLGQAFASLVTAVAPVLPLIAEVVSGLVQALAPALTVIFDALGPVIKQIADALTPVFKQLQPILADVAMQIGNAIAKALEQLAPYIPDIAKSFGDLVLALAPLLPQLVEIGVSLLPPLLDLFIAILPQLLKLIDAFTWLVKNVIGPLVIPAVKAVADQFSSSFENTAKAITTVRDIVGTALSKMGEFFSGLGSTATNVWNTIVATIKGAVTQIGRFLLGLPEISIPDLPGVPGRGTKVGFKEIGDSMVRWGTAMATGGLLRGPGSGTSDSMLIAASNGEYVVNAAATAKTLPMLEAINAGWVPSADFLHGLVPGFAQGGQVPGKAFAQSMDPAKYLMGGFNRSAIDCSGLVSAVVNDALGLDPFASRMSTVSEGQWLAAKGAKPGIGPAGSINIGWFDRGGGANGHTAMTLSDGTNVESNGSDGVVIGGKVGANDPMFDKHMYIPPELLRGGDLGGPATGTGGAAGLGALGGSAVGTGGGGGSGGGSGATGGANGSVAATPVFVTNWPPNLGGVGTAQQATPGTPYTSAVPSTPEVTTPQSPLGPDGTYTLPSTPPAQGVTPNSGSDSTHPLSKLPIPGFDKLFNGPAPWYLAATPEQAVANLGSQAVSLAQRTGTDFASFLQNNWKEMLNTGLAVAGMGASGGGGGGPQMTVNNYGMDPASAASAVERVMRRRTLATQRSGGFGR